MSKSANEQLIIVYEDAQDHRIHKYDTAYNDQQAKEALMRCVERHGRGCNTRIVAARMLSA